MINKTILGTIMGASCIVLAPISFAAAAEEMSKDEWLGKLKDVVPAMICTNFLNNEGVSKQLKVFNIDYSKCVSLIPASVDKCRDKYYKEIPDKITRDSAQQWGSTIGQCIGTDFAVTHLSSAAPESAAPAPSTAPASEPVTDTATPAKTPTPEAAAPAPEASASDASTLTKDAWLAKLKAVVPDLICKGFLGDESLGKQLGKLNINYDKCVTLIPASMDKCVSELYPGIPATIDDESAGKWGHAIGECIGKDFAVKYLM
ncbi:hypothetical protein [Legionella sp. CNM-4043-24]|uniref:hypothetical protein n=1 Tax=Legionella sp. CNM-4043-24 TaxID=3421646 RepID=UPI00403B0218